MMRVIELTMKVKFVKKIIVFTILNAKEDMKEYTD